MSASAQSSKHVVLSDYGKLPLSFEVNEGQADNQVRFLARGRGYSLFLTGKEAVVALKKGSLRSPDMPHAQGEPDPRPETARMQQSVESMIVRMQLAGANPAPRVVGMDELPGKVNYFFGNDPAKWRSNVGTYAKVKYEDVYPGVDLVYYGKQGQLEYDFVVAPGVDPGAIQLKFRGTGKLRVDENGDLILGDEGEEVALRKPVIYQKVGEAKKAVEGNYLVSANDRIAFELGDYDHSRALVIDPVFVYSTYLGGSYSDLAYGIAADASGNAYVAGLVSSADFPTANALQATLAGNHNNAFVSKLNSSGSALVYSTYLGGTDYDSAYSIAVDASGNAYVTGYTSSTNFPTVNAVQTKKAGSVNAFVSKLNPSGSVLVYSTYLGGNNYDYGEGISVDTFGNAYVTGLAQSLNFPTLNALQGSLNGLQNAFVSKLSPSGSPLVYSTYLGGSGDEGRGIAVDSSGSAYVTGLAQSTTFPTVNALQGRLNGRQNAFVSKLSPSGSALVYSTYLGGSGFVYGHGDSGYGVAVDGLGNAYVTGLTSSTDFPTANALQATLAGVQNAFVSKINPSGSALVYSTYLGDYYDSAYGIAVDASGNAYVTGHTSSPNFPTVNALQATLAGAFVSELNSSGSALIYSTYLGGGGSDEGHGIAVDGLGNAYVTGYTLSRNFPTVNALQSSLRGGSAAFVAKIAPGTATALALVSSLNPANYGQSVTFTATVTPQGTGVPTGTVTFVLDSAAQPVQVSLDASGQAKFTSPMLTPVSHSVSGQYNGDVKFAPSTGTLTQTIIGSIVSGLPSALTFGQQLFGTVSGPQIITLTNAGNADLHVSAVSIAGLNPADFAQTNTCVSSAVPTGATCQITVIFAPLSGGARAASVSITDDAPGTPQIVNLSGTGLMPLVTFLSASSVGFGNVGVGTTSAAQTVTLKNSGTAPLIISSVTVAGQNPGDFSQANFCPMNPVTIAPGASCSINVTFTPTAPGVRYASLTINDNVPLNPQLVGLIGTGLGQSAPASPTLQFLGGGSSALFLELGQAAVNLSGGSGVTCIWTQGSTASIVARDNRTSPATDEQGNIWVVWSPGTGTCAAPAGNFDVYSYMSLDRVSADRCFFEVDSSGIPGCVQILTITANSPGANLLCYPASSNCTFFGDAAGGIPATVIGAIANKHWFVAGTDLLPTDAKFATYRMLAPCGQGIWRQPFDKQLRGTYGLGYQASTPGIGTPVQSFYTSAAAGVLDFNITGNDPLTGLAVPPYGVSTIGAQPIIVAVGPAGGSGIGAATDIPGYVLASFYNGSLGRATDLLGSTDPQAITTLVNEPQSGTYNVFEWSMINNSQFHDSQDAFNCSGTGVSSNPLNLQSLNGNYANAGQQVAYRRRVIGTAEMTAQLQAAGNSDNRLGYFFWSASNAGSLNNVKYLTVNGVDPLANGYTDGVLPGADASHPLSDVTFKFLNMGDYPIWTALRLVSQSPTPASVTNLIAATQWLNSTKYDFIHASNLTAWHSHYYLPALGSNIAANGATLNPSTSSDLCPGYLPEFGGDAGGAIILKQANRDFCVDFGDIAGLVDKTN